MNIFGIISTNINIRTGLENYYYGKIHIYMNLV